jgi:hypothetical protein
MVLGSRSSVIGHLPKTENQQPSTDPMDSGDWTLVNPDLEASTEAVIGDRILRHARSYVLTRLTYGDLDSKMAALDLIDKARSRRYLNAPLSCSAH